MARRGLQASLLATAVCVAVVYAAPAGAQEVGTAAEDLSKIVGLVRWGGVLVSLLLVAGASVALRFLNSAVERMSARFGHRRLTFQKLESFTRFMIYIVTGWITLSLSLQINETVLALVGGTLAVAVGFAMRDLIAAMIAGVTILLDRPFQVGDRVQYAGEYGDITAIGLRSVRMQTLDDNTVTIPNNKVLTDVTSSGNFGALDMQVQVDFYTGVDQDIELAERLVIEGMLSSRYVYLEKPAVVVIAEVIKDNFVAVHLRGKGYVLDTKYEKAFVSDVTKRVLGAFGQHGVLPPAVLHRSGRAAVEHRPPSG